MKQTAIILSALLLFTGCAPREKEADRFEELFQGELKIVDLTHPLSESSPYWPDPNGYAFDYDTLLKQPSGAPGMGRYKVSEHLGTHMDAPIHFADGKSSIDDIAPNEMFGPAVVIDVSSKCEADADYVLVKQDILDWEANHGPIPERAIVLMNSGWGNKWEDATAYKNEDEKGQMHFPEFSAEAAELLIKERNILGIGIDNFSVDRAIATDFPVHLIVNGAGKFHLENVANLDQLPPTGAYLINAPIKIEGGSGGQVRIFAVVP
ncbi:MAG: cyclase family protein [Cyclobacteriaceae bacterium]